MHGHNDFIWIINTALACFAHLIYMSDFLYQLLQSYDIHFVKTKTEKSIAVNRTFQQAHFYHFSEDCMKRKRTFVPLVLCDGNQPAFGSFTSQRASNAELHFFVFALWLNKLQNKCCDNDSLKWNCLYFDTFIIGSTESCRNACFQCSQWLKFRQYGDIFFLVLYSLYE